MGDNSREVSLVVSTILEAENLLPLVQEFQSKGRNVNVRVLLRSCNLGRLLKTYQVLLGFPLFPSAVSRLRSFLSSTGPNTLSVLIDHPHQLTSVSALSSNLSPVSVFLKIDAGYGRSGVVPASSTCADLICSILSLEASGACILRGLYSHAGHSYGARQNWAAMHYLADEISGLQIVARLVREISPAHPLILSFGATPTATTIQHPSLGFSGETEGDTAADDRVHQVQHFLTTLHAQDLKLEVHAGVYPTLDLQQLATHARDPSLMTTADIAITIVAEVASVYPGRGRNGTAEALITAGNLALGREPVLDQGSVPGQHYSGWGVLMPWGGAMKNPAPGAEFPRVHEGWEVGRISQEHGILTWNGSREDQERVPLRVGDKVRVWPNHSCIAGACYDYYLVVDSRNKGREDEVVDIWPRWRGW